MSSSELTQRNKNRTIYANYITKIQDNNVGCDTARTGLENGQVAPGSIVPELITGARYTTQEERDRILATNACQFPSTSSFNPALYGDLQLWLDASDVTGTGINPADGSVVTTWIDRSGAGGTATKVGNPTLSATGLNGRPAILLNGTSMGYRGAITNSGSVVTTFAVATLNSGTPTNGRLVSMADISGNDYNTLLSIVPLTRNLATQGLLTYYNDVTRSQISVPAYDIPFYATSVVDGTNNINYINGVAGTTALMSATFEIRKYAVGIQPNSAGDYWKGYVSEVLIYNSALSSANQLTVERYLREKWGIA